jgi:hypothetical protein
MVGAYWSSTNVDVRRLCKICGVYWWYRLNGMIWWYGSRKILRGFLGQYRNIGITLEDSELNGPKAKALHAEKVSTSSLDWESEHLEDRFDWKHTIRSKRLCGEGESECSWRLLLPVQSNSKFISPRRLNLHTDDSIP